MHHFFKVCKQLDCITSLRLIFSQLCFFFVCFATCQLVLAQSQSTLPDALKGIKQADGQCKNDSANLGAYAADSKLLTADLSCAVTMASIKQSLKDSSVIVVDTRLSDSYAQFHVPNSLQLSARDLRFKSTLRGQSLILIGDGKNEREIYSACAQLKAAGFQSVKVLSGGMTSYVASGLTVLGKPPALVELARIDAAQLWAEGQYADNLVLASGNAAKLGDNLPYMVNLPNLNANTLMEIVQRRRKEIKSPLASVVLVLQAGITEQVYRELLNAVAPSPLLIYSDTLEAIDRFVVSQKAVWAAQARGPKQPRCG